MSTLATASTSSAVTSTRGIILDVHFIPGVQLISFPYHEMYLDHEEFEYCDPYCLQQTVETDTALNQESKEVVKQQHFADTSELLDKMNRNQVRAMLL